MSDSNSPARPELMLTVLLWLALVGAGIMLRPLLPIDETRYLTVAWEMHTSGSYIVPHLNGELYSHKPPLLFWLMNAGWAIFGISEQWARLVAPLFGLGALVLTAKMARALWPDADAGRLSTLQGIAPIVLLSGVYWAVFSTMTMFDMLLAFATLVALLGVVGAWRAYGNNTKKFWAGVMLAGLGLGIGGLAKGPAILIHVLPVYLLAPYWGLALGGKKPEGWGLWYVSALVAVIAGFAITLGWAIPAAMMGGPEYRDAIFIGQSAGRMVKSFAHQRPVWWFAQYLPLLLLPWFAWPRLWRAIGFVKSWKNKTGLRAHLADGGIRFVVVWFGVAFAVFSAISGKQLHYLLPEFPAIALFAAYLLGNAHTENAPGARPQRVPALVLAGLAAITIGAWALLPVAGAHIKIPGWAYEVQALWMVPALLLALAVAFMPAANARAEARMLAIASASLVAFAHMAASSALSHAYDLSLPARLVASWQDDDIPVAYIGKYHGEFQFLGRLEKPMLTFNSTAAARAWAKNTPGGIIIDGVRLSDIKVEPVAIFPYRGKYLAMWRAGDLVK